MGDIMSKPAARHNYKRPRGRRKNKRKHRRGISPFGFLLLMAMAAVMVYSLRSGALNDVGQWLGAVYDEVEGIITEPRIPQPPIDIGLMTFEADDWRMAYRFSYSAPGMMDLDRHEVVDEQNFVRLITYGAGIMTIHTYAPAVFDISHNEQLDVVMITVDNPRTRYERIVIIDPGHGGDDTGTYHGGVRESDVNLAISLAAYELFAQSSSGVRAYLTRFDDSSVSMARRSYIGNRVGDLFVAVHNNAYTSSPGWQNVSGTEVLFAAICPMESLGGNPGRANISNAAFSQIMQNHLVDALGTRDRGIVPRYELAQPNTSAIPLAYLEIEFMTNQQARANLQNPQFIQNAAQAIYDGVLAAFEQSTQ